MTFAIIATAGFAVFRLTGMYLYDIIYTIEQAPLENIIQGSPSTLILLFVAQFFWVIGIHENQMIKPIREPLLLASIAVNTDTFNVGKEIPHIINMSFGNT